MSDLSEEDVQAMGRAVGMSLSNPDLNEITHSLNALLECLDQIDDVFDADILSKVQPLPIIIPSEKEAL